MCFSVSSPSFCLFFFFLRFQKDLFLRTDEPHTEKTNRPDCLVLSTHHRGQIFRRSQFPRRHLNKWQILKSGNVPTYFGAQLMLEMLWKTRSAVGVLLCCKTSKSRSFVPPLCPSAMLILVPCSILQVLAGLVLLLSLKGQDVHALTFPSRGYQQG